jgi:hypothetical protein
MASEIVTYDNFKGGERGIINDWENIPGTFRATNMVVLRTGELCVRNGLHNETPAGMVNGKVWLFGATVNQTAARIAIIDNKFYYWNPASPTLTLAGGASTLSVTPSEPVAYLESGRFVYFTIRGDGTYKFDPSGHSVTKLTSAPGGGKAITVYNDLLIIGNTNDSESNRIFWSDVGDFATWPVDNFLDIGPLTDLGGLYVQNNHLTALTRNAIWILYGQPGYNDTLRQIVRINGNISQYNGASCYLDEIYFTGLGSQWPEKFNGVQSAILHNLEFSASINGNPSAPEVGVIPLRNRDEGVIFLDKDAHCAILLNDIWTYHTFGVTPKTWGNNDGGIDNAALLHDGGATGAHAKFFGWEPTAQHPGLDTSRGDDGADYVSGQVYFPMRARRDGAEFKVRTVSVNFRKWDTGSTAHNHFDVKIKMMRVKGSPVTTAAISWDEDNSAANSSGVEDFVKLNIPENVEGNAFQLQLENIRGVAIQSIMVELEGIGSAKH